MSPCNIDIESPSDMTYGIQFQKMSISIQQLITTQSLLTGTKGLKPVMPKMLENQT